MKKTAAIILLMLAVAVSFAVAAKETQTGAPENNTKTAENAKNMTFGQCVSDAAAVKNTCYETAKTARETCVQAAQNATDSAAAKTASKSCSATYKKDQAQCKADFKSAKKECGKIKHSAWEGFKASFK